jgi:geranylgeranyl diphosphate/geranylgeranyl-bacteriochlorophyllide a reductase
MSEGMTYDAVVVGGGPAGATAAHDLARAGRSVLLLDRAGRIKPCGGAVPPRLLQDFAIPDHLVVARVKAARMVSPTGRGVDMPVGQGFVGMVDRGEFDEWLRARAAEAGVQRRQGVFLRLDRDEDDRAVVRFREGRAGVEQSVRARVVIGADGANSAVARQCIPGGVLRKSVFAYHEVIEAPVADIEAYAALRADVIYEGSLSPDFYAWIFPHGSQASIGVGSADKGFALRDAVARLRARSGLDHCRTIRHEGAPIPLKPLKRWENGRDVLLVGDAAGVVAPASGEGIYYAMACGRMGAEAAGAFLETGEASALKQARRAFMREHGRVFWVLGMMQYFWYSSDRRRERFVSICADKDVQELTWQAYMHKRLVRRKPVAHLRIFLKDLAHLLGLRAAAG